MRPRAAVTRALTVTVVAVSLVALGACRGTDRGVVEREVASPDGARVARYYVVSGGGAAGYVDEYVDVRPRGEPFDPYADDPALLMTHGGGVTLTWRGPDRLVVEYPGWAGVSRGCRAARGVTIEYVARAEPDSAWGPAARAEWESARQLDADLARRGEPPIQSQYRGLTGRYS